MKKAFFTSAFMALVSFATFAQGLQLTYKYSYYDVYHIQKNYQNYSSCITTRNERGGSPGGTKIITEYKPEVYIDSQGSAHTAPPTVIRREEEVPSTEYSYQVYKNTCPNDVRVKAIRKVRLSTGQIVFEDGSFWVKSGNTKKSDIEYVDDYNSRTAGIGSTIAYKNNLAIDPDEYNTYVNLVANSNKGTLVITPTTERTRIYLNQGDKVIINAEGRIKLGAFAGYGGPDGIDGFSGYSTTSDARHGSLIYTHTGIDGWRFAGSSNTITANKSGYLWLAVNDNKVEDDEGQFIVNYEIIRAGSGTNYTSNRSSLTDITSTATTNNTSTIENNKFAIRNSFGSKVFFELSRDESNWTSYSLDGLSQSDYWYTDQQQSFFRIKMFTKKVYKIEAGKKYKIDWNKSQWCFDLFSDGDR